MIVGLIATWAHLFSRLRALRLGALRQQRSKEVTFTKHEEQTF